MVQKPNKNGHILAPSEKATPMAEFPTIFGGFAMVAKVFQSALSCAWAAAWQDQRSSNFPVDDDGGDKVVSCNGL